MNERAKQRRALRQARREALGRLGGSPMIPRSIEDDEAQPTTRPDLPRHLHLEGLAEEIDVAETLAGMHLLLRAILFVLVAWMVANLGVSIWHVLR